MKVALCIGINYIGKVWESKKAVQDSVDFANILKNSFKFDKIVYLNDIRMNCTDLPTKSNILTHIDMFVNQLKPGDQAVLFFSGYGFQILDRLRNRDEKDFKDEVICPYDFETNGIISDDVLFDRLVCKVPTGARLISFFETGSANSILDLQYNYKVSLSPVCTSSRELPISSLSLQLSIPKMTDYINQYRNSHQAGNIIWSDSIANVAQSWANHLANTKSFKHSGNNSYGENLAWMSGYDSDPLSIAKKSIDMWYDEVKDYNFSRPGFSMATGHFTCLVWKNCKEYGLGIAKNGNSVYVVYNCSPPSNYMGQFQNNVFPKTNTPIKPPTTEQPIKPPPTPIKPPTTEQPIKPPTTPIKPPTTEQPIKPPPTPINLPDCQFSIENNKQTDSYVVLFSSNSTAFPNNNSAISSIIDVFKKYGSKLTFQQLHTLFNQSLLEKGNQKLIQFSSTKKENYNDLFLM